MDTVWVDTMFPGIDPDEGWEKNLERVVNYDYLLKEYLDWQLKHLNTDNMDPVDWANVQAEIISMAAGQIDLTAYYTGAEVDNIAQLVLAAAEDYATAEISAKVGDIGSATVKAYADNQIAGLSLAATGSGGNAQLVLQSGGSTIAGSGAALSLSVNNNANGYSTVSLAAGNITLATSGNITLGGAVVFAGDNISRLNNNAGYQTSNGVTTIIGDTITTGYINSLYVTAKNLEGGTIKGCLFYSEDQSQRFSVLADGWYLEKKISGQWKVRALLYQQSDNVTLILGADDASNPRVMLQKYYANNDHYLWLGDDSKTHGLKINLETGGYQFS